MPQAIYLSNWLWNKVARNITLLWHTSTMYYNLYVVVLLDLKKKSALKHNFSLKEITIFQIRWAGNCFWILCGLCKGSPFACANCQITRLAELVVISVWILLIDFSFLVKTYLPNHLPTFFSFCRPCTRGLRSKSPKRFLKSRPNHSRPTTPRKKSLS